MLKRPPFRSFVVGPSAIADALTMTTADPAQAAMV
jgi:hypothetical protein